MDIDIDYDKLGVIEKNGKTITRLEEGRRCGWRVTCDCCGALIAASDKGIKAYTTDDKIADTGILWCHHFRKDGNYKTFSSIFERIFAHLDHPSFCKKCMAKLTKRGWDFCDCGCGG